MQMVVFSPLKTKDTSFMLRFQKCSGSPFFPEKRIKPRFFGDAQPPGRGSILVFLLSTVVPIKTLGSQHTGSQSQESRFHASRWSPQTGVPLLLLPLSWPNHAHLLRDGYSAIPFLMLYPSPLSPVPSPFIKGTLIHWFTSFCLV